MTTFIYTTDKLDADVVIIPQNHYDMLVRENSQFDPRIEGDMKRITDDVPMGKARWETRIITRRRGFYATLPLDEGIVQIPADHLVLAVRYGYVAERDGELLRIEEDSGKAQWMTCPDLSAKQCDTGGYYMPHWDISGGVGSGPGTAPLFPKTSGPTMTATSSSQRQAATASSSRNPHQTKAKASATTVQKRGKHGRSKRKWFTIIQEQELASEDAEDDEYQQAPKPYKRTQTMPSTSTTTSNAVIAAPNIATPHIATPNTAVATHSLTCPILHCAKPLRRNHARRTDLVKHLEDEHQLPPVPHQQGGDMKALKARQDPIIYQWLQAQGIIADRTIFAGGAPAVAGEQDGDKDEDGDVEESSHDDGWPDSGRPFLDRGEVEAALPIGPHRMATRKALHDDGWMALR
ncbi:hypothetical protein LTR08_005403 [Meristemomyces frigidus]|nr:hypothetical protein LTR08_005403 [Meristemomyces frigidus]